MKPLEMHKLQHILQLFVEDDVIAAKEIKEALIKMENVEAKEHTAYTLCPQVQECQVFVCLCATEQTFLPATGFTASPTFLK